MFYNYIKISFRNILRHKVYSLINILGLALGMAISMLIFLISNNHLNYDEHFENYNHIYRINILTKFEQEVKNIVKTPIPLAKALTDYSSEVKITSRILKGSHKLVSYDNKHFTASNFYYTDNEFIELFNLEITKGEKNNPLKDSSSIIITEKIAAQFFGTENPIGKILKLDNGWSFTVTAICKEFPKKTHFHFDYLADLKKALAYTEKRFKNEKKYLNWQNDIVTTYFKLKKSGNIKIVQSHFDKIIEKEIISHVKEFTGLSLEEYKKHGNYYTFKAQKINNIHTGTSFEGEFEPTYPKFYINIFISFAFIILVLASINFINLTTARSSVRATEIGIRKVAGASRRQLISQFFIESIILSIIALIIAISLIEILYFLDGNATTFKHDFTKLPLLLLFTFVVAILSGFYPAFHLSSIKVINTLKGNSNRGIRSLKIRKILIIIQLSTTFIILISRGIIFEQINFFNEKNLSLEKDQLIIIKRAYALDSLKSQFVNELKKHENIINATYLNTLPGEDKIMIPMLLNKNKNKIKYLSELRISNNFFETFDIKTVEKKNLKDSTKQIQINQSAIKLFNLKNLKNSIYLNYFGDDNFKQTFEVTGIIEDFHFQPLYEEIKPTIFIKTKENQYFKYLIIRIKNKKITESIQFINKKWNEFVPDKIFEHLPLKQQINTLYKKEHNTAVLFALFSILAVLIAIMGIFGLTAFTTDQRKKEIGIRKALGTPTYIIIYLLSVEFIKWLIISFAIASPIAYFIMNTWLDRYAYHIEINYSIFIEVGIFMFFLTLITVSLLTLKAAINNPSKSLRYE